MFLSVFDTWRDTLTNFFAQYPIARIIVDAYLSLIIISFVVFLALKFKKALNLLVIGLLMLAIYCFSDLADLKISKQIYYAVLLSYITISVVIIAPEIRKYMEYRKNETPKNELIRTSTTDSKQAIVDAVFNMSSQKVGALISLELHNSLDQYAEHAISLNADITRELLEQIFIKDTPLHDGGVIIRGNKIVCAAAYYTLTQDFSIDKTIGSRHRAAIGLSENTDSLTIIVSEETGQVHVATAGFMKIMSSKTELLEYINFYMGN